MSHLATFLLVVSAFFGQAVAAADPLPEEAAEQLQQFVGNWKVEGTARGLPLQGRYSAKWAPAKHCLMANYRVSVGDQESQGNILIGWDSVSGEITQLSFFTNGILEYLRFKQESPGQFTGKYVGSGQGQQRKGNCKLTKDEEGTWSFTTVGLTVDGKEAPELQVTMTRAGERTDTKRQLQATREEFQEFGDLCVGRWVGEITLIADWPGISKKQGEKVNSYMTTSRIADGKALAEKESLAEGEMTGLVTWHADIQQIRAHRVTAAGDTSETIFWKDGEIWRWKHAGVALDGKKLVGRGTVEFQDDGKTQIFDGTLFLDGEELPHYHDVYTRVNK